MSDFNSKIIEEFRANDGAVAGPFEGTPMLLLSTTGAKTGQTRVNPLVYLTEGNRLFVFASKAGAPSHPDWYRNVLANPRVTVEVGKSRFEATAQPVEGAERDRIYAAQVARFPNFGEYQANTERVIPVIELTRVEAES